MLFNSIIFFLFFPVVALLFFSLPHRFRWVLLLIASYIFYMYWHVAYALILVVSTLIDYFCGKQMARLTKKAKRKPYLILSLLSNLGILFTFKYFNFFNESAKEIAGYLNVDYVVPAFSLLLPVGISFYTFQTMSYSIDVYRGEARAEKNLGIFSLFVVFFPQLVAGPIERSQNLIHQFYEKHTFDYSRITNGLKLMAWGLFKKMVIADRLAVMVDYVYNDPAGHTGFPVILATVFFAFQVYCDFSGYSDIAIGGAQVLGFRLMDNFNRPYYSKSIREFWKRWHISLSTWFRDYVYIPMGGNRVSKWQRQRNLFFVFLVSGLWHGASWNFVIWGALHGAFVLIESQSQAFQDKFYSAIGIKKRKRLYDAARILVVFSFICFAWIFFRAATLSDALYIIKQSALTLIKPWAFMPTSLEALFLGQDKVYFFITAAAILFMEGIHFIQRHKSIRTMLATKPVVFRWTVYFCFVLSIIFFGKFNSNGFIYFQF